MEHIRNWKSDCGEFEIDLYDRGRRDDRGCARLYYELWHAGELIFYGNEFCGSPIHADDSDDTVGALIGFLSLRPGDTDPEFFEEYTEKQMAWVNMYAEELGMIGIELEEQCQEQDDDG
jgi:hypothetical protein